MNEDIEGLYQKIGTEACAAAPDFQGKLLVYAEVEDGAISGSVFYERGTDRVVTFRFCSEGLINSILSLWEKWKLHQGNVEWRAIAYLVRDGKFSVEIIYPEQMNHDEDLSDRRPRVIEKYFGDAKVDYSRP